MGVMVASTISPLAGLCFKDVTSVNTSIRDETGLLSVQIHVEDPSQARYHHLEAAYSIASR